MSYICRAASYCPCAGGKGRKACLNNLTLIDCVAQMRTLTSQYNQLEIWKQPGENMNTSSTTLLRPTVWLTGKTLPSRWNIVPSANSCDSPACQMSGIKQHGFLKYSHQKYTPINEQPQYLPASPFLYSPWTANLYPPLLSSHKHGQQRGRTRHHLESEQVPVPECQIRIINASATNAPPEAVTALT